MPDGTSPIGTKVRDRRLALNLSERELAERSGVSRRHISRVESGASSPTIAMLCRLAEALGVDARDLLVCPDATVPAAEAV